VNVRRWRTSDGRGLLTAARALEGIRVVDLTKALAGPYATMMLADVGADVIKVEPPGGDDSRGWLPFASDADAGELGISAYFLSANRGKRSVTLDLKSEAGAGALRRFCAEADVLVENYRPGLLKKLGLDPAQLREENPRLVTLSITGFGSGGPDGHRAGFDQIAQAEAGLMSITGAVDGEPTRVGLPISDLLAGMFGAFGVMAALAERERTGRGQAVETSLVASVAAVHSFQGAGWLAAGRAPVRTGNRHPSIAPYGTFRCEDTDIVIAVGSESLWRKFAAAVGIDPDRQDIATNSDRVRRVQALESEVNALLAGREADEVLKVLDEGGIPAGRIRSIPEVWQWEQVRHLGLAHVLRHPVLGDVEVPGGALQYGGVSASSDVPPPLLGQHQADVDDPWRTGNGADVSPRGASQ
jgi:crotonobetainyl-CoA:carnitine CoA-transferase CaiB-like acyl-CoA transferase